MARICMLRCGPYFHLMHDIIYIMLIVANWKMNPETVDEAKEIAGQIKRHSKSTKNKIILCPPFTFLSEVSKTISGSKVSLGAQDVFIGEGLSHTGEISPEMLK